MGVNTKCGVLCLGCKFFSLLFMHQNGTPPHYPRDKVCTFGVTVLPVLNFMVIPVFPVNRFQSICI